MSKKRASPQNLQPIPQSIAILNIGGELLDGRTVNTNATYFAERLRAHAVEVVEVRAVEDKPEAIAEALLDFTVHKYVLVTGGLGPTADDITATATAAAFGDTCRFHPAAERAIQRRLKLRGTPYTTSQRRQAYLPRRAKVLPNQWGIAPGFLIQVLHTNFYFMPGVPRECRPMFEHYALPELAKTQRKAKLLHSELWRCYGIRESEAYDHIAHLVRAYEKRFQANFQFSSQVPFPVVDIRVDFWRGRARHTPTHADIQRLQKLITTKLGPYIYSHACFTPSGANTNASLRAPSLAETVLELLRAHKFTLATAESCTGGFVGKLLTDIPGSSDVYLGGVVSYADSAKEKFLNVKPTTLAKYGAVSEAVAQEMAQGIRDSLRSHYAISLTGISGPGGGTAKKPVGTLHLALIGPFGTETKHQVIFNSAGDREQNRTIASHLALDMLRKNILQNLKGNFNGIRKQRRSRK